MQGIQEIENIINQTDPATIPFHPDYHDETGDSKAWNLLLTPDKEPHHFPEYDKIITEKDREIEMLKGQIQMLINRNNEMQGILENTIIERNHLDNAALELKSNLDNERAHSQYKITYLLKDKQEAENRIYQQQETIGKYAKVIEQLQSDSKNDREMLHSSSATFHQMKIIEDDLRNQVENLQYKVREDENTIRCQSEDMYSMQQENQNLQNDLKSLISIEQALRIEISNLHQKYILIEEQNQQLRTAIVEDRRAFSETLNENENMKQDLVRFHKTIELGMRENEDMKKEIIILKDELMNRLDINNQSASAIANKDQEIYGLSKEIARLKSILNSQKSGGPSDPQPFKPPSTLDMLLNKNTDSFAADYLRSFGYRGQPQEMSGMGYADTKSKSPASSMKDSKNERFSPGEKHTYPGN